MRSHHYRYAISSSLLMAAAFVFAQTSSTATVMATGSALNGKEIYAARCSACHSVDANRTGPLHFGVLGRKAGGVKSYKYSDALKKSKVVWTSDNLISWLKNPEEIIPGQRMGYSLELAEERLDVVAYLATLK
jgi:cytochrome c